MSYPEQEPSNFVTYAVRLCLPCDDGDHATCYGGLCDCEHIRLARVRGPAINPREETC